MADVGHLHHVELLVLETVVTVVVEEEENHFEVNTS